MNTDRGTTWPEQDAVDKWLAENKIDLPHSETLRLKKSVTAYRLEIQSDLRWLKLNIREANRLISRIKLRAET